MNKQILLFLFLTLSLWGSAQLLKPIFKEDEFGGEFYSSYRDRLGYVWISTDQGVYRWDSKNIEHFTTADGLPSNEVFRCYMDSKERVWMTFYNGDICYYYRGKIYNKLSDKLLNRLPRIKNSTLIETNGYLYCQSLDQNYMPYFNGLQTLNLSKNYRFKISKILVLSNFIRINNKNYIGHTNNLYDIDNSAKIRLFDTIENTFTFNMYKYLGFDNNFFSIMNLTNNQLNIFFKFNQIARLNNCKGCELINVKENKLVLFKSDSVFIIQSDSKKNFKRMSFFKANEEYKYISQFSDKHLVLKNKKNAIFYTGLDKYLTVMNNSSLSNFQVVLKEKNINNQSYKISYLEKNNFPIYNYVFHNNYYYISRNNGIYEFKNNLETQLKFSNIRRYSVTGKSYHKSDMTNFKYINFINNVLHFSTSEGIFNLNKGGSQIYSNQVSSFYLDSKNRFWLSKKDGIFYTFHYNPTIKYLKKLDIGQAINIQSFDYKEDQYGNLLIATNAGLYLVHKNNKVYRISTQQGLTSNDCKKIYLDTDGSLWVTTNIGVNHIQYWKDGKFQPQRINYFLKADGLQSDNIRDIAIQGDSLYIVSDKGLDMVVNKHWRQPPAQLPIHINRLYINSKRLDSFQFPNLKHDQNSLQIDFSVIYYDRTDRLKIFYRLIADGDTTLQEVQDRTIRLQSLAPNDYQLQIYAYDQDYPDSIRSAYKEIRIHIHPPFYKTWWFFSLLFLTVLGISGWIIYLNFKRKNDQLENDNMRLNLEKDLSKFKLEALKAEMNPHFIFNCLNSIKNYILQSDIEKSQYYLSQLSKLIRIALYNTKEEFISLRSELEFIDLYIELEQLRYDHQFDFEKEIASPYLLNAEIPTMVLQPFFENAVRHGKIGQLGNKRGKLKLDISEEEGFIVFLILDNGIGIEEAQKIKTESNISHKSMALDIIKERIAIYNQSYELDMQLKIEPSLNPEYTTAVEIRYVLD